MLTALACALFISLGRWQWSRGDYRTAQWSAFANASAPRAVTADLLDGIERYARVAVQGQYDVERQFLLDNITQNGRAGYEVLTPLRLADGSAVLVDRGFVPGTGDRGRLPDVALPADSDSADRAAADLHLLGRIGTLPVTGIAAGRRAPAGDGSWPRVASFPTHDDLAALLPYRLHSPVLLLDADSGPGFARGWRPPGLEPARHYAYAVQWWAFAVLAVVLLIVLNFEKRTDRR